MGLKKRTPIDVGDALVASKPAPKKKRIESPRLRDSLSSSPRSYPIAASSQAKASSSAAEKTPEMVIVINSPPATDQDEEVFRQDEGASRQDDDLASPPRRGEGGSSRRPGEGLVDDDEGMSRQLEIGGSLPEANPDAKDNPEVPKAELQSCNPHAVETWWRGDAPLMENQLTLKDDFDEASQHHVKSGGKFATLIQKYETALRAVKDEVLRMQREQEKAKDVNAMVADLKLEKLGLEGKVATLNREIVKSLGLQDMADRVRAQVADLEEKSRRDAEAAAAEVERLRQSRQERVEVAAIQVYNSVNEWSTSRLREEDQGVDLDFDAVKEKLEAKLAESVAGGDSIDEVVIGDDDFAKPRSFSVAS
ncbi:unnamed protein product [Microthlaspi erraticum]|uniref:Uncharacterized protein n=1 Tax=Microthlaspi erraticum TaxID=1685480 RepID=A0A6D2ITG7_9BRAS|nr:unnamed protein product [Microthlaspi erraticum]